MPTCVSLIGSAPSVLPRKCALLIGLTASDFSWTVEEFMLASQQAGASNASTSAVDLMQEFGKVGTNQSFRSMVLSSPCILGQASAESQRVYSSIRIRNTMGMTVDRVDCNIAGPERSCSEMAAKIEHLPTQYTNFQFTACNEDDIVTLNGMRIFGSMGAFPLKNGDICGVGARVFVFIEHYS